MAHYTLVQATVTTLSLIVSASCLHIDVQPRSVRPSDKNVTFTCAGSNGTDKTLEKIFGMRLLRLDDYDHWAEVAVLRFDGSIHLTDGNATAVGHLGDVLDSHLIVTWPVAPDNVYGRYQCHAIALTSTGDIVTEKSTDLNVKSLSNDLSVLLERLKKSEKRLVGNINETMLNAMESSETNLLSILDSKFESLKEYLDNKTAVMISARKPEEETAEDTMHWPAETFTLLMPDAGCPLHPPAWIKSFMRSKANPEDKYYPINVPLHLANPHKKDGFIYRQFCTLPAFPDRTKPWPAGSYCLYRMRDDDCPAGFEYSRAQVHELSNKRNLYQYYYRNHQAGGQYSIMYFRYCCRHDGSASNPIDLPVSHPFYLFRHRGRCQEVKGMDVTQDIFMKETLNNGKSDKWRDGDGQFYPDVSFKPYKEELCYYSRSRS